ncbi:Zinc resistance conferring protein [Yamadazyma tenuis]|uniref:Cation efflux protein n=1 Tax=Candida tenuis (strain ATCC 10573 / BCRC 21748 / CBS 615 / JCM 9827 / NBRC 10315 / NRRL Y-1498 / VKM Y-70) TaxID=590646 RepID=G3BDQ8_CANTC|nr:cation efflux protein [Yamadazyma tenuis ATCC 10573]XP_006690327.1 uncharacterized protein CANTEDRAFT_116409 [Yamadazyma tenuis ATCC 10573]EGV61112.1 cation efflux protein [Yamadazyma tenuis ATCC 10573]EGV61113.1 hypothetical protein CANTEDRAFT_116409 [Yamadazyma tenuis ATCC 10573]WEJ94399.1 Zinc resistance conferring protein [Yamadazyma tenuis]
MNWKEVRIISLLVLDTVFFLLEAIVGYTVHSLALVADSFHMLNDIISLFIALWAVKVKNTKPADGKYTYGWQRAEILGALINAVFLLALCFTIVIEAIQRLISPPEISNPVLVLVVGCLGLASNFLGLALFHEHGHSHGGSSTPSGHTHSHGGASNVDEEAGHSISESEPLLSRNQSTGDIRQYMPENFIQRFEDGHHHNSEATSSASSTTDKKQKQKKKSMNMEAVFLHVLGDALGNIGVILSALIIWKTSWAGRFYSDPIISLFLTVIIFSSALPLCKKSSKILLQATPTHLDSALIIREITKMIPVKSVHDFHVWNLNEDILIASLHLQLDETLDSPDFEKAKFVDIVREVREILHKFDIHNVTIQPEFTGDGDIPSQASIDSGLYGDSAGGACSVDKATGCFNKNCLKHN